ncbi:MAG: hypothetical protein HZA34_03720 [Candidatus Pacebacteria bacterium]|nr:hypothetical protein [Candidatus Paceibacterota bacterium]
MKITQIGELVSDLHNETDEKRLIERIFSPVLEKDEGGFWRKIYTYGETKFVFRGREELPTFDSYKDGEKMLGSTPIHINEDEYGSYLEQSKNNSHPFVITTMDIQGVIEIADNLGVKQMNQPLRDIKVGGYTQEITDLIDKIIACRIKINKEGSDGEAIVLASMLGDDEAMQFVQLAMKEMEDSDKVILQEKRDSLREQWEYQKRFEKADVKDLIVVHATRYLPQYSKEIHGFEVLPTGESTSWKYLRNTVHTTLNHKVKGHYGGHWDNTPHVIISPFTEVRDANGNPFGLDMLDTWWVLGPGERLKFPKAKLVTPGDVLDGELIEFGEDNTYFKSKDYTIRDVFRIDSGHPILWKHMRGVLNEHLSKLTNTYKVDQFWEEIKTKYFPDMPDMSTDYLKENSGIDPESIQKRFIHGDINESLNKRIGQILMELGLNSFDIELEQIANEISIDIEKRLFGELNEMAVNQTIQKMKFPLRNDLVGSTAPLGEELDSYITPTSHNYSIYNFLEHGHAHDVQSAVDESSGKFIWTKYSSEQNMLRAKGLDPKTRRVLYVSGMFNSRFER